MVLEKSKQNVIRVGSWGLVIPNDTPLGGVVGMNVVFILAFFFQDSTNEMTFLRLRSRRHEILIAPDREFILIVIQNTSD